MPKMIYPLIAVLVFLACSESVNPNEPQLEGWQIVVESSGDSPAQVAVTTDGSEPSSLKGRLTFLNGGEAFTSDIGADDSVQVGYRSFLFSSGEETAIVMSGGLKFSPSFYIGFLLE